MARSVIVSAVRTPFGKLGGGLAGHQATELGALVDPRRRSTAPGSRTTRSST